MNDLLVQILMGLVSLYVTAISGFVSHYLIKKGHVASAQLVNAEADKVQKEIATKKTLATDVIQYVEQKYGQQTGILKFSNATQTLIAEAKKYGFDITPESATILVESALKEIKVKLGEQWSTPVATSVPVQPVQPQATESQPVAK